jgi:hypothetical protein
MGKVDDHQLGTGIQVLAGVRNVAQKLLGVARVERDDVSRRQHHGIDVDRKRRCGDDGRVSRTHHRQAHVAEALFRADRGHNFCVRVEPHAVPLPVTGGDFFPQIGDAGGDGVPVVFRIAHRLGEFVADDRVGRIGGVAHPQIDHVDAGDPLLVFHLVDLGEQIRGKASHPISDRNRKGIVGLWRFRFAAH